jgi:multiple sugar transport system substrate-binding protein
MGENGVLKRTVAWFGEHRFSSGALAGGLAGLLIGALVVALLPDADPTAEPVTAEPLVILSGADQSENNQRQQLIEQWNATHEQQARIVALPTSADAAHAAMLEYAQSKASKVDIYNLDVTWTAEFAANGYIVPLPSGVDTAGFLDKPLLTCRYDGKLWALPFNSDAGLLYYRTDLVADAPHSLTGLTAAIDGIRALDPARRQGIGAGYVGQLGAYEGRTVNLLETIWAAGGDVVDARGKVVLKSDDTARGLRWLADGLAASGTVPAVLRDSLGYDEQKSTQAFAEGRTVFLRNWPVAYRGLLPAGAQTGKVQFAVTTLPGGASVLGGQNLAVASRSTRPKAARQLIAFLTGERSQQILFERGGYAATRRIVYLDERIRSLYPYTDTLLSAIEAARPRPITPHYVVFSEVFREVADQALANHGQVTDGQVRRLENALQGRR